MATPYESAQLILQLYEQRREECMRKARDFMFGWDPRSADEFMAGMMGENSAYIRMVFTYWDMAASLVLNGAIDSKMFFDANGEQIAMFGKVEPYLPQLRQIMPNPNFLKSLEGLCLSMPDGRQRIDKTREFVRGIVEMRKAAGAAKA